MISEGFTQQPDTLDLVSLFTDLNLPNKHKHAEKNLNMIAARDPGFIQNIIRILEDKQVRPEVRLVASTHLNRILEQNLQTTGASAQFELVEKFCCKVSFRISIKAALEAGGKCAKVEQYINLTQKLWESGISGKKLAMLVVESQALAKQVQSDFVSYINIVLIDLTKSLAQSLRKSIFSNQQIISLLGCWANSCLAVVNRLVVLSSEAVNNTESIDMLSFLCSHQCFSDLIIACYFFPGSNEEIDQLKISVSSFHKQYIAQVFKLDEKCTTFNYKALQNCLVFFSTTISSQQSVFSNQQFCINILNIMSLCSSQSYFNNFFINTYLTHINSLLFCFKFDENDTYNFDNQPQQFIFILDDILDEKTAQTLKCEAVRFLTSLVYNIDGAATYVFMLCFNTLKARVEHQQNGQRTDSVMELDQAFMILSFISQIFKFRDDLKEQIRDLLLRKKQEFLTELVDIEITMLYYFLSCTFEMLFSEKDEGAMGYIVSASTPSENPTVDFMGLHFISNLIDFEMSVPMMRHLTERLKTEQLKKYEETYIKFLKKVLKQLTQDDLIGISTILMQRIKKQMGEKISINVDKAFNILGTISGKKNLMEIDVRLRAHLKQLYPLLSNMSFKSMDHVFEIINHILLAQPSFGIDEYSLLPNISKLMNYYGSVDAMFFTLALFIRKTSIKDNMEIVSYLFEMMKIAIMPTYKSMDYFDVGQGLLLLQLFLRKFACLLTEDMKKQLLQLLPSVNLFESNALKASITNAYLKVYPYYASTDFRNSILETIQDNQKIFLGYERKSLIQGLCQMALIQLQQPILSKIIYIIVRKLQQHKNELQLLSPKKKNKQSSSSKSSTKQHEALDKSANIMLQFTKRQDFFSQFQNTLTTIKQSNQLLYTSTISSFPQYFMIVLKQLFGIREVTSQVRRTVKIRTVKNNVDRGMQEQDNDVIKRKRYGDS